MLKTRLNVFKFLWHWLRLVINRNPPIIDDLFTDVDLMWANTTCRIVWNVRNTYKVKLFINDLNYGSFTSNQSPFVHIGNRLEIGIIAYGFRKQAMGMVSKKVLPLVYKKGPEPELNSLGLGTPDIVRDFQVIVKEIEPASIAPVIRLEDFTLDTPYMRRLEEELYEYIDNYQKAE